MLFNSYEFLLLFLPVTAILYQVLACNTQQKWPLQAFMSLASLVFIAVGSLVSLALLLVSLAANYGLLRWLAATDGGWPRRRIMIAAVSFNLCFLGVFKYADFLAQSVSWLARAEIPLFEIVLPLAISFYTFEFITLIVDSWRTRQPCPPPQEVALFVTVFPHLIAGPILRWDEMRDNLRALAPISAANLAIGLSIFAVGLFKKTVIADSLAPIANTFFAAVEKGSTPTLFEAWGGTLAYTFQIYFDFSGYSDMAIGLARIFGIALPANFLSPYKATSIIEFWRRWHITLSRFLRDYLYVPLGGNRQGPFRRWVNVAITMLLGGLWHGASWNFALWGGLHGILIAGNHAARGAGLRLPRPLAWTATFLLVVIAWVLFRTHDLSAAERIYAGMIGAQGIILPERLGPVLGPLLGGWVRFESSDLLRLPSLFIIAGAAVVAFAAPNVEQVFRSGVLARLMTPLRAALLGAIGAIGLFGIPQAVQFVYFRF
jgi:alginate O-acetyltransferase complex protein AlgI